MRLVLATVLLLAAAAMPAAAQEHHSLLFDGIDDHVEIPFASNHFLFLDFTVELRVMRSAEGGGGRLISQVDYVVDALGDEAYSVALDDAGFIHFLTMALDAPSSPHELVSTAPAPAGAWAHVAVRFEDLPSGRIKTIFLDGQPVGQAIDVGDVAFDDKPLYLGGRKTSSDGGAVDCFAGRLDEVRIWAVARTQADIQQDMDRQLTGSETGLRGLWSLNEGTGTTATDLTAYGIDGTIVGAVWNDYVPTTTLSWGSLQGIFR
ncbi:MAG TPA: LamG domain-containing protein [Candidatus Krumholzibacteria bacterium]|nr:LamG domain-containing protein [Candidatus Krumholzibacteria bacterium]